MNFKSKSGSIALFFSLLLIGLFSILLVPQETFAASASDGFNRSDGSLGSNWTDITDGGLTITSDEVAGNNASGNSGDTWTANTFGSDQYSQIEVTATQLTGGQWMAAAVRLQSSGQEGYVGLYFWNNGSPELMLFRRDPGNSWTQLGAMAVSPLAAGTQLQVKAVGSTISMLQNGTQVLSATDTTYTGGAPGIMDYQLPTGDNWSGGDVTVNTYTIGGTVSGLSGTVVLQDNGGDDFTATTDGSFTFTTPVADGATYHVTVKNNPTGQTCLVTNGSGTVAGANITNVAVSCSASSSGGISASDDFNRANGPLGTNWTDMTDGGLAITSNVVTGTTANGNSGDIWNADTFTSDQYSQIEVTATQISGGQWVGPVVRAQNGGLNLYTGIYFWNNGSPELMLFKRSNGAWTQLGSSFAVSPLAAGTQLEVKAVGSTISMLENGTMVISATDSSFTGGAPGIMAYQAPTADNWTGGNVASATYSVGGTVSGLSGTVVLQNNGGDDVSVSANGSFTFATLLNNEASYNVTVKTNPTGQTCTVSNGSGTIASANVTTVAVSCSNNTSGTATDDFNRANGPLGANWTDMTDGGLAIASNAVAGTISNGTTGDIRTAETYDSNQYSQVEVTATPLANGAWIGPMVRAQSGGSQGYVGIYYNNNGTYEMIMYKRSGTSWTQLGNAYTSNTPFAAGTQLKLMVVGSTLAFLENGVERAAAYDASYTGGAPAIISFETGSVDNWAGGKAGFEVHYLSTDANGVDSYDVISENNGPGPQILRVLKPTNPATGVAHNFIYTLPVTAGLDKTFGDGLDTIQALDAQDQYNLTVVEPTFGVEPWYADNPNLAYAQQEKYMTTELQPWVKANLGTSGTEQHWLIGFSKSGIGGIDLLLKHSSLFTLGGFWDFPADMATYDQYGASSTNEYGTDANFQANYRLTSSFLNTYKASFATNNRIWIGSYGAFQQDMSDFDTLLTTVGIAHSTETPTAMTHAWDSGWVQLALPVLEQDSIHQ